MQNMDNLKFFKLNKYIEHIEHIQKIDISKSYKIKMFLICFSFSFIIVSIPFFIGITTINIQAILIKMILATSISFIPYFLFEDNEAYTIKLKNEEMVNCIAIHQEDVDNLNILHKKCN